MAGLWERIRNVWSNEMLTQQEGRTWAADTVIGARTDTAQRILETLVTDEAASAAVRSAAISMGVPAMAISPEIIRATVGGPQKVFESDWLRGYDSDFKYAIGHSADGFQVGTYIADAPDSEFPTWGTAVATREEAEFMAEAAQAEWSRKDIAVQHADEKAEAECVAEQKEAEEEIFAREWGLGARDAVVEEREIARFERSHGMSVEV